MLIIKCIIPFALDKLCGKYRNDARATYRQPEMHVAVCQRLSDLVFVGGSVTAGDRHWVFLGHGWAGLDLHLLQYGWMAWLRSESEML